MKEHQTNNTNTQETTPEKPEKPSLFSIIFCFVVGISCIVAQVMSYIGNGKILLLQEVNSGAQLLSDIISNVLYNFFLILGLVFLIPAIKACKERKEWKEKQYDDIFN